MVAVVFAALRIVGQGIMGGSELRGVQNGSE